MFRANNRCADNNMNMESGAMQSPMAFPGMMCDPIIECPCERVVNRQFCHQIQHIQPIHTRIINNHVYNHSFVPQYTCCEENRICHVYDQNPCC